MALNASKLWRPMLGAARDALGDDWKTARAFAEPEMKRLARVLADIGRMAERQAISELEARALLRIHANTTETVLLTIKGLGILAVERALNAALDAVRGTVNATVGLTLL